MIHYIIRRSLRAMAVLPFCLIASILFTGCDDFLDEQPRGSAIAETTDDYNALFNSTQFMNLFAPDYTKWLNPDVVHDSTTLSNLDTQAMYAMMGGTTTYGFSSANAYRLAGDVYAKTENCDFWAECYKRIYTYNVIANGVMSSTGGTDAQRRALQAEARFSRAWLHFVLAQIFAPAYQLGNDNDLTIPIVQDANSMETHFTRATKREFYDWVEQELTETVGDLEDRSSHNMRIYKTNGYALLGKYYFLTGQYEKALEPLRTAYQRLQSEGGLHFINYNEYNTPNNPNTDLEDNNVLPNLINDPEMMFIRQNGAFLGAFTLGAYGPAYYLSDDLYNLYDSLDIRRNYAPSSTTVQTFDYNTFSYVTMVQNYKGHIGGIRDNNDNYGVSMPEVYLYLAETEARVGDQAAARRILTEFRANRIAQGHEGVPDSIQSQDDLIRFCVDEQRREFVGGIQGYYNLRRLWNDPLFQDRKPLTRSDGKNTYTFTEDKLYIHMPEGVLKWNEEWRNLDLTNK